MGKAILTYLFKLEGGDLPVLTGHWVTGLGWRFTLSLSFNSKKGLACSRDTDADQASS